MELRLRKANNKDPKKLGRAYSEAGQGMGPTLNAAADMGAYKISDRATWANFHNRRDLEINENSVTRIQLWESLNVVIER